MKARRKIAEKKEHDYDVNYDETVVPNYHLPELLITEEGKVVSTSEDWMNVRRPQILSLFSNLVYGRIPFPESNIKTEFKILNVDSGFMNGKATRKEILIRFSNEKGKAEMSVLVFVPNNTSKPVPAFMMISFDDSSSGKLELDDKFPEKLNNGVPLGDMLDRGYAFISVYHEDLVGHNEVQFEQGIHPLFFKERQSFPKAHEWGVISVCGWQAMRALDYLETDADFDCEKVVLMGHSKLGKAALWAAAQERRFAIAISANSGCAGAALWRRRYGETLAKISRFPHWLCTNSRKFINREDDLPVDQHMLLALIAPRPVYVASATEDRWADSKGEYLSAYYASEVYELLGKQGLTYKELPEENQPIINSDVGYHIRTGGHYIDMYDWYRFLEFADYHFEKLS